MSIDRAWWMVVTLPPVSSTDTGQYFVPCPGEGDRVLTEHGIWDMWDDARISYVPRH